MAITGSLSIKSSMAGFNTSRHADRSTVIAFVSSYKDRFPQNEDAADVFMADPKNQQWLEKVLGKGKKLGVSKVTKPQRADWIPRDMWIPDNPSPRATYKHEATRIAQNMRKQLEAEEGQ